MSSTPITSRVKRSPLLKYSPLKNDNEEAIKTAETQGPDKEVVEEVEVEGAVIGGKNNMSDKEWKEYLKNETPEQRKKRIAREVKEGRRKPSEKKKVKKNVPGDKKKVDVVLKRTQEQQVLQPWEVRQQNRATKVASRNVSKAEKKLERMKKRGLEGTERYKAAEKRLAAAKSMQDRVNEGASSGFKAGERIKRKDDRVATTGEFSDENQLTMGARRQEVAEKENISTSNSSLSGQASKAVEVKPVDISSLTERPDFDFGLPQQQQRSKNALDLNMPDFGKSPLEKSTHSPLKKALKGNQYKLPQHSQKAILASPNKMKAPLKKGYFKGK